MKEQVFEMVRRSRFYGNVGSRGALVDQFGNARVPRRNELLRTSNTGQVVRSRPTEHDRVGHLRGGNYISPQRINAGLAIGQTGARALRHKNKTYYALGGGLFTRGQILESRWRYGELMTGRSIPKKVVGL